MVGILVVLVIKVLGTEYFIIKLILMGYPSIVNFSCESLEIVQ